MAVRFLPPPEDEPTPQRDDQENLAEVIEFRSKLRRPSALSEAEADDTVTAESERGGSPARADVKLGSFPTEGGKLAPLSEILSKWPIAVEDLPESSVSAASSSERAAEVEGPTAYETAVKLLSRRPLSSGELQRALVLAGHPEYDAEDAVATCQESLYIDDVDLARAVATKLRESKGESSSRIRQKLKERHLPAEAIEAALEGLDEDEEHALLKQTAIDRARRMAGLDRQTAERRLLGFLARRGWSGERATRAVREALDGSGGAGGSVRFR